MFRQSSRLSSEMQLSSFGVHLKDRLAAYSTLGYRVWGAGFGFSSKVVPTCMVIPTVLQASY